MQSQRVQSVDALRGLVMVIMALDHTREYFHAAAQQFQPENLARTTAAISSPAGSRTSARRCFCSRRELVPGTG
jgi:uncharacterized membrane protein